MPFNGSGSFSPPGASFPAVANTLIEAAKFNAVINDIATNGLSNCITKDGQTTVTANIPMAGFRLTGLGAATARTDAIQYAQVQDGSPTYLTATAGTNTITATAPLSMSAYATGQSFRFVPANTNTGATTLNINSIGAKNVYLNNVACSGGELLQNVPVEVMYDGTQFQIIGPVNLITSQTFLGSNVLLNNTGSYFDVINTGSIGAAGQKWEITATLSGVDTLGAATILARIWDGSTVYAESPVTTSAANYESCTTISAVVTLAAATTFYLSAKDLTSTNGRAQTTGNAGTANKATSIKWRRIS